MVLAVIALVATTAGCEKRPDMHDVIKRVGASSEIDIVLVDGANNPTYTISDSKAIALLARSIVPKGQVTPYRAEAVTSGFAVQCDAIGPSGDVFAIVFRGGLVDFWWNGQHYQAMVDVRQLLDGLTETAPQEIKRAYRDL